MVFPRVFKYRTHNKILFRRIFRVKSVRRDDERAVWCITKLNGAYCEVPMIETVVMMGRLIERV